MDLIKMKMALLINHRQNEIYEVKYFLCRKFLRHSTTASPRKKMNFLSVISNVFILFCIAMQLNHK